MMTSARAGTAPPSSRWCSNAAGRRCRRPVSAPRRPCSWCDDPRPRPRARAAHRSRPRTGPRRHVAAPAESVRSPHGHAARRFSCSERSANPRWSNTRSRAPKPARSEHAHRARSTRANKMRKNLSRSDTRFRKLTCARSPNSTSRMKRLRHVTGGLAWVSGTIKTGGCVKVALDDLYSTRLY